MGASERRPGAPAPEAGIYEELNIFGTPTGRTAAMAAGEALPDAPRGFTWRPLSDYSAQELRSRAVDYRILAATARTAAVADSLRGLAERFDVMAERRAQQEDSSG